MIMIALIVYNDKLKNNSTLCHCRLWFQRNSL